MEVLPGFATLSELRSRQARARWIETSGLDVRISAAELCKLDLSSLLPLSESSATVGDRRYIRNGWQRRSAKWNKRLVPSWPGYGGMGTLRILRGVACAIWYEANARKTSTSLPTLVPNRFRIFLNAPTQWALISV